MSEEKKLEIGSHIIYTTNNSLNLDVNIVGCIFGAVNKNGCTFSLMELEPNKWAFKMHNCKIIPVTHLSIDIKNRFVKWALKRFLGAA